MERGGVRAAGGIEGVGGGLGEILEEIERGSKKIKKKEKEKKVLHVPVRRNRMKHNGINRKSALVRKS